MEERIGLTLPAKLKEQVIAKAEAEGRPLSVIIRQLLRMWLRGEVEPFPSERSE